MPLIVESFGPFVNGVSQGRNPSLDGTGFLRHARHVVYSGTGKLSVGGGSAVAITLMDDAGSPAEVTSVCEVVQFGDGVLAVGHSTATDDCYLYRLDSGLTGWYDLAGAFTASSTATPLATVLWSSMTESPVVHIAEMLGQARITCTNAQDAATLNFPTRIFTGTAINNETADLDVSGAAETVYATGCVSFQAHSWIWGFGSGTVVANTFRPELLRFGGPNGGALDASGNGSIAVGHRVRSNLERVVSAVVAGDVMYVGTTHSVWPIVGYGRDSWDKSKPLDDSYGFIGPKSQVAVNGVLYYWSPRGPMRVSGLSQPEPLWDMVPEAVLDVTDPEKMVAAFNRDVDQVQWFYRGTGATANRMVCAFDTRRDIFVGPDRDIGILVGAANWIVPVVAANATPAAGPSGPPTTATTTSVGATSALAGWTNGDAAAATYVEYRIQGGTTYTAVGSVGAGVTSLTITGLATGTAYEWRAYHLLNGQASAYLGPVAGSQFTTTSTLNPPTNLTLTDRGPRATNQGELSWTNSADSGQSTEVYLDGAYVGLAGVGESSYFVTIYSTASYTVKVRHVKSGVTSSAFTGDIAATLTYGEGF